LNDQRKLLFTLTLKGLERDGLITRKAYPTIPPRVEYELTRLGRSLLVPIKQLGEWATQNRQRIQAARDAYDTQKPKKQEAFQRSARCIAQVSRKRTADD
jgi:DNA-binding HxlR family transcriptional regulator